jgi:hypothetical protein
VTAAAALPASGQMPGPEQPLLPEEISTQEIVMHGRYARQWKQSDGTLVITFNGAFRLDFGLRRLKADDAVVWIEPRRTEPEGRKYYELTVYLSGRAEVRESAGTVTEDSTLLVSNIRTSGRIVKLHDAHSTEPLEDSDFYRQALSDRKRIEQATTISVAGPEQVRVERPREPQRPPRPPRVIRYRFGTVEPVQTSDGRTVQVVTGGVYFSQAGGPDSPVLEIRAESAVVFPAEGARPLLLEEEQRTETEQSAAPGPTPGPPEPSTEPTAQPSPLAQAAGVSQQIEAVYLEGDVVLSLGNRFVRASRVYYDFQRDRALILDGVFRTDIPEREIPLYVRADQIRQLSTREFTATRARVSTSEFYTPHYHVGAERVYIRDTTPLTSAGTPAGPIEGQYELQDLTFNIGGVPIAYWPYSKGEYRQSETLVRSMRLAHSDQFGFEFESRWYLFNLLGARAPEGYDATLDLDYLSERGPGIGVDVDYEQKDHYGLFRGYYIHDDGEDTFGPLRDNAPDTNDRGRVLWRHRHYLPQDWELTLEFSYITDPGFLEEYEKSEWFEGKDQETVFYLKRAKEVDAITFLANWRLLDFVTQTEHLPDLAYRRIGDTFLDPVILYHESRIGAVRFRPDDRRFFDSRRFSNDGRSDVTFRGDLRQEAELPLKFPGLNLVVFSTFRGDYWDGQPLDSGGLWRGLGLYGLRGGSYLYRVYDEFESELLDVHRIRHIINPYFTGWWSHSNARSTIITPFDEGIETIDDFYGFLFGVRQTWQTKRGAGDLRRTVDLLTLNLEVGAFGDPQGEFSNGYANFIRPEDSRTRNYFAGDLVWRLSDTTSVLYDFNFDLNDMNYDRHNVSVAVERSPRLAYVFGWRDAEDIDLNVVGGGYNYKLNEKHITAFRIWWDVDRLQLGEMSFTYVRRLPRWYLAFTVDTDEVFDDLSFSVSVWPEGIPEWTLGSRRWSGLATSTGIRP